MKNDLLRRLFCIICTLTLITLFIPPISTNASELPDSLEHAPETDFYFSFTSPDQNSLSDSNYASLSTAALVDIVLSENKIIQCALYYSSSGSNYQLAFSLSQALKELASRVDAQLLLEEEYYNSLNSSIYCSSQTRQAYLELLLQNMCQAAPSFSPKTANNAQPSVAASDFYIANGVLYNYSRSTTTRGGKNVDLYCAQTEYSESQKNSIQANTLAAFPDITALAQPTTAYNCHSYAWYNQNSSNQYWIFDIDNYITDAHTCILTSGEWSDCSSGDLVVYYDSTGFPLHSAIISSISSNGEITCISKWGADGLYSHAITDVPANYYYNYNTGILMMNVFSLTSHNYGITSNGSATHTKTCEICSSTIVEAHTYDVYTSKCIDCGYTNIGLPVQPFTKAPTYLLPSSDKNKKLSNTSYS